MKFVLFGLWVLFSILGITFVIHKEQIAWKKKKWVCLWIAMAILTVGTAFMTCIYYKYEIVSIVCLMLGHIGIAAAAVVDMKDQRIPNYIVAALLGASALMMIAELIINVTAWKSILIGTIANGVIVFIVLYILSVISRDGLGMGDVKLLTAMGFLCGAYEVLNIMVFALLSCVLVSMILVLTKTKKMKDKIAFGPFIYIGYAIVIILGA